MATGRSDSELRRSDLDRGYRSNLDEKEKGRNKITSACKPLDRPSTLTTQRHHPGYPVGLAAIIAIFSR